MEVKSKYVKVPKELLITRPDKYKQDITILTKVQLVEIMEREKKLLSNKSQLGCLPDKGQKIKIYYEKVLKEIAKRDEMAKVAELFSELNIAETGEKKLTNLEWTGSLNTIESKEIVLDSDDEETDPLKIIARSTNLKKQIKFVEPEKSLITENDLKEIEEIKIENNKSKKNEQCNLKIDTDNVQLSDLNLGESSTSSHNDKDLSNNSSNLDPHVVYIIDKYVDIIPKTDKFLEHKTTKTNVHDPNKEKLRKIGGKHWEITAATPPPIQHCGTKLLPLRDSVEIQIKYIEKLKKLQEQQATERLAKTKAVLQSNCDTNIPQYLNKDSEKLFSTYREPKKENNFESNIEGKYLNSDSDEDVHDDDYYEDKGGMNVNYTVRN